MNILPKAIIFDWDGTLVNTIPILFKTHNHVRKMMEVPLWSFEDYKKVIHRSTREVYPELYGRDSDKAMEYLYEFYHKSHLKELSLFEGAKELIRSLSLNNVPLAVVSNKNQFYLEREIIHLGWEDDIQIVIGSGLAKKDKPHADPLNLAISKLNLTGFEKEILYVGDTGTDLETSNKAGCLGVLLLNSENKDDLVKTFSPHYVFDNCLHLQNELNKVIQKSVNIMAG